jgi:hypothetical protein
MVFWYAEVWIIWLVTVAFTVLQGSGWGTLTALIGMFTSAGNAGAIADTAFEMWVLRFLEVTATALAEKTSRSTGSLVNEVCVQSACGTVVWTSTVTVVACGIAGNAVSTDQFQSEVAWSAFFWASSSACVAWFLAFFAHEWASRALLVESVSTLAGDATGEILGGGSSVFDAGCAGWGRVAGSAVIWAFLAEWGGLISEETIHAWACATKSSFDVMSTSSARGTISSQWATAGLAVSVAFSAFHWSLSGHVATSWADTSVLVLWVVNWTTSTVTADIDIWATIAWSMARDGTDEWVFSNWGRFLSLALAFLLTSSGFKEHHSGSVTGGTSSVFLAIKAGWTASDWGDDKGSETPSALDGWDWGITDEGNGEFGSVGVNLDVSWWNFHVKNFVFSAGNFGMA